MSVWGKNDSVTGRLIGSIIRYNRIKVELTQTLLNAIPAFYKKVRLVYVKMTPDMRTVITQGILMNTLYRNGARESNSPFAVPD
ncbi:MAG: hypothetical protein LBE56_12710 [Tannerella sp.]|jgi:hypothetical protein|nr:hypothetical protein [Tannerella sp.]